MATKTKISFWPFALASAAMAVAPSRWTEPVRLTALGAFRPVRSLAQGAHGLAAAGWEKLRPRHTDHIERQNEFLRSQIVLLHAKNGELAAKLEAATATRGKRIDPKSRLIPADVIVNTGTTPFRDTLVVSAGSRDGVARGMLVLHHGHVVGRIEATGPWTARVQLTTDPGFKVGAVAVPKTYGDSFTFSQRDVGIFEGKGENRAGLKWRRGEGAVEEGSYVLTTEDRLNQVPKGLILGKILEVERGRSPYPLVRVSPIVDPRGLEFVLILGSGR